MKITVTHDDGSEQDITELVRIAYDVATQSMDWGSGFLDREETNGLILLAEACHFPDVEEKIAEIWKQRAAAQIAAEASIGEKHARLQAIARERGVKFWFEVKPTAEERAALLTEARAQIERDA